VSGYNLSEGYLEISGLIGKVETMIDLTSEFGRRVDQSLKHEEMIWLTTVTPAGAAQPNPVWFYWDGEAVILYSQPGSYRVRNILHIPRVALNLEDADVPRHNLVVNLSGARFNHNYVKPHPRYEQKYSKYTPEMSLTFNQLVAENSVEITIKPTRLRGA
jgi:PPOX class probable F420-dependent enzyme